MLCKQNIAVKCVVFSKVAEQRIVFHIKYNILGVVLWQSAKQQRVAYYPSCRLVGIPGISQLLNSDIITVPFLHSRTWRHAQCDSAIRSSLAIFLKCRCRPCQTVFLARYHEYNCWQLNCLSHLQD
jgi:hypothetical protein